MKSVTQSRAGWQAILAASAIVLLQAANFACQHSNVSRVRIELKDLPSDKPGAPAKPLPLPLMCPAAGIAPLQPAAPGTGHHKVILTWNASVPSKGSPSAPAGYCLYRSQTQGAAKKYPRCTNCEQVNQVPVPTTGCIDDVVVDSTQYYYVVTAIAPPNTLSTASNEVPVHIPGPQTIKPVRPSTLPLCRVGLQTQAH